MDCLDQNPKMKGPDFLFCLKVRDSWWSLTFSKTAFIPSFHFPVYIYVSKILLNKYTTEKLRSIKCSLPYPAKFLYNIYIYSYSNGNLFCSSIYFLMDTSRGEYVFGFIQIENFVCKGLGLTKFSFSKSFSIPTCGSYSKLY